MWVRWARGCPGAVLVFAAVMARPCIARAQSYMRMSPQAGSPVPFREPWENVPNTWLCWIANYNGVSPFSSAECPYDAGDFMYFRVNPPTKNVGTSHTVYFWVQGSRYATEDYCITAYSYNNQGDDYANTGCAFPPIQFHYDVPLATLTVPPYGTTNVTARFTAKAQDISWASEWYGLSWNFN